LLDILEKCNQSKGGNHVTLFVIFDAVDSDEFAIKLKLTKLDFLLSKP
jgi:hypothetical protein